MKYEPLSIEEILSNNYYIIPRYQRNYAWEKTEIAQLIRDINEYSQNGESKNYYLGSLVCFKREDGVFELVDGQQRFTTLVLINLVLKNWNYENKDNDILFVVKTSNLKFDSRKRVQNYIDRLYNTDKNDFINVLCDFNDQDISIVAIKDAIEIIQEELRSIENVTDFSDTFYNKVYLFHVDIPKDTDLNHYFEIMNNRGEQLEKHEIVKALLMGKLATDDEMDHQKFAMIWEACSDMSNYVNVKMEDADNETNDHVSYTLKEIIEHNNDKDTINKEKYTQDKYKSIINFSNFLLQVLKLRYEQVALDDKKLLQQFKEIDPEPKIFINDLLKYRKMFDTYVIKQDITNADETKQNWGIRKLDNADSNTIIKTFEDDEEIVKIELMLYYSDSSNTYNDWLHKIMKWLSKNENPTAEKYRQELWEIAKSKFNRVCLSYPNITIYNLYFIDFLLWKLYKEKKEGAPDTIINKIENIKNKFNNFKFRQLTSREHLLSQEHARRNDPENISLYNGIGNLCLISASQNSKGNKENPIDKKKLFQDDNSSLKRLIMFESFENNTWGKEQIRKHQEEIKKLVDIYLSQNTPISSHP
ncbi:DUF262 domain-containing protein [Gracilinema caldarium]|uniref:DUF262 domain-containing protein n=1 Tax=Gracilinema caldarium (strain ATCC 51460 / DSM 7334 / H1) TaxID=744872 RepID=F8F2A9_GRAC1|nr:DUF262 domain-containing protein [Gracilinema caldarium]AEJ20891.1 protein of unknown function DUF262 [Gracilinema caldarium DSM 7334]